MRLPCLRLPPSGWARLFAVAVLNVGDVRHRTFVGLPSVHPQHLCHRSLDLCGPRLSARKIWTS